MALSLNCFLVGRDLDRTFVVEIESSKKVSILKDLIKEKNPSSLGNVDVKNIDLWAVNLNLNTLKQDSVDDTVNKKPKLSATKKLSAIFDNVPNDHFLHIIAKVSGTS